MEKFLRMGRPPKLESPEQFEERALAYFCECADERKGPKLNGLILSVGLRSRSSLDEYGAKPEYADLVAWAKCVVALGYEWDLSDPDVKTTGPIFALKNMGWQDNQKVEHSGEVGLTVNIKNYTPGGGDVPGV